MVRSTKKLQDIDKKIGANIMDLRIVSGFSRDEIAKHLDVTHQQIQKYEKGINRICIGRLLQIASFLKVDCKFLFKDLQDFDEVIDFKEQRQSLEIFKLLKQVVDNEPLKNSISMLVKSYLKTQKG